MMQKGDVLLTLTFKFSKGKQRKETIKILCEDLEQAKSVTKFYANGDHDRATRGKLIKATVSMEWILP